MEYAIEILEEQKTLLSDELKEIFNSELERQETEERLRDVIKALDNLTSSSRISSESGNPNLPKFRKPPPLPPPMPRRVQGTKRTAVCLHCGLGREFHSKYTKMCGDSMHRFEAD